MNILEQVKDSLLNKTVEAKVVAERMSKLNPTEKKELAIWLEAQKNNLNSEHISIILKIVEQDPNRDNQLAYLKSLTDIANTMVSLSDIAKDGEMFSKCDSKSVVKLEIALDILKEVEKYFSTASVN